MAIVTAFVFYSVSFQKENIGMRVCLRLCSKGAVVGRSGNQTPDSIKEKNKQP